MNEAHVIRPRDEVALKLTAALGLPKGTTGFTLEVQLGDVVILKTWRQLSRDEWARLGAALCPGRPDGDA